MLTNEIFLYTNVSVVMPVCSFLVIFDLVQSLSLGMYPSVFFQPLGRRVDLEGYYKAIVAPPGI